MPRNDRRSRVWGYDARWSRRVGTASDLDVQVGYGSATLDRADVIEAPEGARAEIGDQQWRAVGAFSFSPAPRHRLRVGMSANLHEYGSTDMRLTLDPDLAGLGPVGLGDRGWTLSLFGKESYAVTGPLALDVGFDYHHMGFEKTVSFFLPQAGVTYSPGGRHTVRALVMVKLEDRSDPLLVAENAAGGPEESIFDRVGYLVAWDRQFDGNLSLSMAAAFRPYAQENLVSGEHVAFRPVSDRARFVSDGNATSRELSLRLEKRMARMTSSTGFRIGEVEGSMVSFLPNDIQTQEMAHNLVRFLATTLQTAIIPSGTHVTLDFRRIQNDSLHLSGETQDPMTYTSVDMLVQQQLFFLQGGGEWRLLVGYRTILNTSEGTEGANQLARLGVPAEQRRVSGGVSIRF